MIFGFNTDVKVGDTVYHVQSEARKHDQLLQTQVFVRGRCIGKKATSYTEQIASPDFNDDRMHEMLKSQHKFICKRSARAGSRACWKSPTVCALLRRRRTRMVGN